MIYQKQDPKIMLSFKWLLIEYDNANEHMAVWNKLENFPAWGMTIDKSNGKQCWQLTWYSLLNFTGLSTCVAIKHANVCSYAVFDDRRAPFLCTIRNSDYFGKLQRGTISAFSRYLRVVKIYLR